MELEFLTDPANANLFAETVETSVPETTVPESSVSEPNVPEPSVPEPSVPKPSVPEPIVPDPSVPKTTVKPQKRRRTVTQASSKKRGNDAPQKNKKEPEPVSAHVKI